MRFKAFLVATLFFALAPGLHATPKFWKAEGTETPTPLKPPVVESSDENTETKVSPPVLVPSVKFPTPTPTPLAGLHPKDPTQAALFSVVLPGSGQVYAGDPLKGLIFAAVFGVGLWQTIDNFQLIQDPASNTPSLISKNETAGDLFGLVTLAAYGFGIQDAFSTAANYNRQNHLSFRIEIAPGPTAKLACLF